MRRQLWLGIGGVVCAMATVTAVRADITVDWLGDLGSVNGPSSTGLGVSGNGDVVTGDALWNGPKGDERRAFRWTKNGGMENLGTFGPGAGFENVSTGFSYGVDVSDDGTTLTGFSSASGVYARAFRYSHATGTLTQLPAFSDSFNNVYNDSRGAGISGDGSTIVGYTQSNIGTQAAYWRNDQLFTMGLASGATYTRASDASYNGNVIIGIAGDGAGQSGFRYGIESGYQLLDLPGGTLATPYAVTGDGNTIVGDAVFNGERRAWRWTTSGGFEKLGVFAGANSSMAYGISDNGNVLVGQSGSHAYFWTQDKGMIDLRDYLSTNGLDMNGQFFTAAQGISADGTTIVGTGTYNGTTQGWRVRVSNGFGGSLVVPETGSGVLILLASMTVAAWMGTCLFHSRRRHNTNITHSAA